MAVQEDPQNPTDQLTKALTELKLSEGEIKKIHWDLDTAGEA